MDLTDIQAVRMAFLQTLLSQETPYPWNFLAVETDNLYQELEELFDFTDSLSSSDLETRTTLLLNPFKRTIS